MLFLKMCPSITEKNEKKNPVERLHPLVKIDLLRGNTSIHRASLVYYRPQTFTIMIKYRLTYAKWFFLSIFSIASECIIQWSACFASLWCFTYFPDVLGTIFHSVILFQLRSIR